MDKVMICPVCEHEIENHECEQCEENEQKQSDIDQNNIDNYIDGLMGGGNE
jgi:hypothetical protein